MALDEGLHDLLGGTRQPTSFIVVEILLVVCRAMQSIEIRGNAPALPCWVSRINFTVVTRVWRGGILRFQVNINSGS
jgi:hypothetical protein